jgi:hypothetical protein
MRGEVLRLIMNCLFRRHEKKNLALVYGELAREYIVDRTRGQNFPAPPTLLS